MQKSKIKMGADGKRPSNAARAGGAQIQITNNGPYLVSGGLPLMKAVIVVDARGTPVEYAWGDRYRKQERYSLCRCGKSRNPPFCDGTHTAVHFSGEETANREPYIEQAGQITGPALVLTDAEPLCALARFCHRGGDVWTLTEESDDPESRDMAIRDAWDCPAGRLVVWDPETEKPMEPGLKPGIAHRGSGQRRQRTDMGDGRRSRGFVGRDGLRSAQPRHAVPVREIAEQAVLRREAYSRPFRRRG
jgi:CDGSH-type Zn-finger protein